MHMLTIVEHLNFLELNSKKYKTVDKYIEPESSTIVRM